MEKLKEKKEKIGRKIDRLIKWSLIGRWRRVLGFTRETNSGTRVKGTEPPPD